jgi:arylsulfatase
MTNIALVVLDTLRYDAFEEFFDWLPGVRFTNVFSPGHYTIPAHAGIFTGQYPSEVGTHAKSEDLTYEEPVLAEVLSRSGYTTRGFTANVLLSPWNNWDRGFDEYRLGWRVRAASPETFNWSETLNNLGERSKITRYLLSTCKCILSESKTIPSLNIAWHLKQSEHDGGPEALEFVSNTSFGDNEFLFLNLMEAHLPYRPPTDYQTVDLELFDDTSESILGGDTNCDVLRQAYNDSVRYLSDTYNQIFTQLKENFDYILTVSDHGELFGEHNARAHWHGVYPELVHVPLSIWNDESEIKYRDEPASLIDLHQTILAMANFGESPSSRGRDLRTNLGNSTWLTESNGLRPSRIDSLQADGFSQETISQYDTPLFGIGTQNYYGWQTVDSFEECGDGDLENPVMQIENKRSTMKTAPSESSKTKINRSAQSQLEDLGYL